MFRYNSIPAKNREEDNPFLLSFSDLMAGLLAIFILVLVVTLVELEKRKAELRFTKQELIESLESIQKIQSTVVNSLTGVVQRENSLALMLKRIQENLKKEGIEVKIAENGTVLRIPEHQLQFDLGKYDIAPDYTESATAIGKVLLQALQSPENRMLLDTVFVEGHTDSVPNHRNMGNWGLSTYRAISLWHFWTESPGNVAGLKALHTIPPDPSMPAKPLISVSGYADTRSTHGNKYKQLEKDRPEDRRIDIRFTMVSSEKENLESVHQNLSQMQEETNQLIQKLKDSDHEF